MLQYVRFTSLAFRRSTMVLKVKCLTNSRPNFHWKLIYVKDPSFQTTRYCKRLSEWEGKKREVRALKDLMQEAYTTQFTESSLTCFHQMRVFSTRRLRQVHWSTLTEYTFAVNFFRSFVSQHAIYFVDIIVPRCIRLLNSINQKVNKIQGCK